MASPVLEVLTEPQRDAGRGRNHFVHGAQIFTLSGAIKIAGLTASSPFSTVKHIIQTQDANPKVISGEVPRYTSIGDCFKRLRCLIVFAESI